MTPRPEGGRTRGRPKKAGEAAFAALMLALSLFLLWQAHAISGFTALSSPGAFPMAVAAVMVASSALILVRALRAGARDPAPAAILPPVVLATMALMAGYAVLLRPLGFLPTSLIFLVLSIRLLRGGGLARSLGLSVACLVGVYVVFRLVFSVLMPAGIVPEGEILAWIGGLLEGGAGE